MSSLISSSFAIAAELRPVMSVRSGSAPSLIRLSTTTLFPFWAAMWSGVAN